jgi:hypothetical protein
LSSDLHGLVDLSNISLEFIGLEAAELLVTSNNSDTDIMLRKFGLLCTCLKSLETVSDKLLPSKRCEGLEVLLKVGLG